MNQRIETTSGRPVYVDMSEFDRIRQHTPDTVNSNIQRKIIENVRLYGSKGSLAISDRIDMLERELDVERGVMLSFAASSALFLIFGAGKKRSIWRLLAFIQLPFLVYHAISGWCPPVTLLRRLGFRTSKEIDAEKYALKSLRGDFHLN